MLCLVRSYQCLWRLKTSVWRRLQRLNLPLEGKSRLELLELLELPELLELQGQQNLEIQKSGPGVV